MEGPPHLSVPLNADSGSGEAFPTRDIFSVPGYPIGSGTIGRRSATAKYRETPKRCPRLPAVSAALTCCL